MTATPPATSRCFDWAVIGHVTGQSYLGQAEQAPLDGVFALDIEVRQVIVGEQAPKRVRLGAVSHSEPAPVGSQAVALFLARGEDGATLAVHHGAIGRDVSRDRWASLVRQMAADEGLVRCGDGA